MTHDFHASGIPCIREIFFRWGGGGGGVIGWSKKLSCLAVAKGFSVLNIAQHINSFRSFLSLIFHPKIHKCRGTFFER